VFYSFFERLKHQDIAYRVAALWGHYKFYAKFLIIAIFIELFYLIYTSKKWAKILCFLLIITSIFSLILTASRTEIIFTLVGIIVFLSFYKARLTIAFSIFILTILTISFLKIPVFKNRLKPMFFKDNKFGFYMLDVKQWKERMKTWKMGIEVLKTNYKYFGVGLGNSRKFIIKELKMDMKIKNLHNSFIEVIVSFGIFGFLIFIYFLFTYFFEIYKSISYFKNTDFFYYGLGLFISSFILFIFVGFIDDIFWNKRVMMQLLYLVGILLSFKRNENSISI
jgi:O-antigen ligase